MRCISPLLIRKDGRRDVVPCGQCNYCLQTKRADWSFRIQYESRRACTGYFLTLTYDDEKLKFSEQGYPELCKKDLQLFTKSIRKHNDVAMRGTDYRLRYYSVGEYGTITARPHYHCIMLNLSEHIAQRVHRYWQHGYAHVGTVTDGSIHYTTKYVINRKIDYPGREPPFAVMSRRPGLGAGYTETHRLWHKSEMRNYTQVNGITRRIPRYLKDKIFDRFDRNYLNRLALAEADTQYLQEIERLSQYSDDPFLYYDERVTHTHNQITSKINSLNTF